MNTTHPDKQSFFVSGVCCSTEEAVIRKRMDALSGVESYSFNPITCELRVNGRVDYHRVVKELRDAGFGTRAKHELEQKTPFWEKHKSAFYTGCAALLTLLGLTIGEEASANVPFFAAILIGGWRIFLSAWTAVRSRILDMNVLMSIAVVGAMAIDQWAEGASVVVLFSFSLMLESYSSERTRRAIQSLVAISPEEATVLRSGGETVVAAEEVQLDDIVVVRPGERVPFDSTVIEGTSSVDQSPITGESMPVSKGTGAVVYAGSINGRGTLKTKVTRLFEDSTLARIVHMVQDAQEARAPIQTFVDRFARRYTPLVLCAAAVVAIVPPLVFGEPFVDWFYRSLVLLVIACPCALVISTPVTIVSALTVAMRHGVLIKGGKFIESLSKVRALAFDKTGTLTHGRLEVTDVFPLNSVSADEVLLLAAALEHYSEHHVASALVEAAHRNNIAYERISVSGFEALPGRGVKAMLDGKKYFLGNHELCEEWGCCSPLVETNMQRLTKEGKTVVVLGNDVEVLALIAVRDEVRVQSASTITELRQAGIGPFIMLSGDNEETTRTLSADIAMDDFRSGLMPHEKVETIKKLKETHGTVAMVGDGINDAPALAASSVGIAMGTSGTDAALETADVVLTSDDISRLPFLFRLSKKAIAIVKQNIAIALGLKVLFLLLAVAGFATLWMAILADDGAALLVVVNGLRLLRLESRPERTTDNR